MRQPGSALVVDASILIAMMRGRSSYALAAAAQKHHLLVTGEVIAEAHRRIELGMKAPELIPALYAAAAVMTVIPAGTFDTGDAESVLKDAVASRNGSIADAHILTCAWTFDADIWSFDRDFAGTGVPSWSTANLMRALAEGNVAEG
jgi:predicted nucleic acid-binding protein